MAIASPIASTWGARSVGHSSATSARNCTRPRARLSPSVADDAQAEDELRVRHVAGAAGNVETHHRRLLEERIGLRIGQSEGLGERPAAEESGHADIRIA